MFGSTSFATVAAVTTFIFIIIRFLVKKLFSNDYPTITKIPGPITLPLLGSLPHIFWKLKKNPLKLASFQLFKELKKIWGPLVSLQLGKHNIVVIDELSLIKKLLASEDWSNRIPDNEPIFKQRTFGQDYGLLTSNGESWREMRRYVHKTLVKFGFGRGSSLELRHQEEIIHFMSHLNNKYFKDGETSAVVDMQGVFNIAALNILWTMVADKRFSYESEEIAELTILLEELVRDIHPKEMGFLALPFLRFIPGATAYTRFMRGGKKLQEYFRKVIKERRSLGFYKIEQNNFVDSFLSEIDLHKENNIITEANYYKDEQLIMVLVDLFITGFLPIASCLEYLIMFMLLNPQVQDKCRQEINSVVGVNQYPSHNHTESLTYVSATCHEVLRKVTFIPLTSRAATRDTYLDGYFVKKDTLAAINLYHVHHNPEVWKEPWKFSPERFIGEDGKLTNLDFVLPFGTGKRTCPAEVFSRLTVFTFFSSLLQQYTFKIEPNSKEPDSSSDVGLGNYPKPFKALIVKQRKDLKI